MAPDLNDERTHYADQRARSIDESDSTLRTYLIDDKKVPIGAVVLLVTGMAYT